MDLEKMLGHHLVSVRILSGNAYNYATIYLVSTFSTSYVSMKALCAVCVTLKQQTNIHIHIAFTLSSALWSGVAVETIDVLDQRADESVSI